ncbi:MAG: phosphate ABC transporter substrate-binding protein [Gammaproteobacteria bacterium]|nr:phosphate ABC transporter substrate-binding protein [Gammaproteobacteria bacterium]
MFRFPPSGWLLAGLLILFSLPGRAEPADGHLRITGSSTMAPLITAMARRFEELHPDVRIVVEAGGSSRGIKDAREGKADIGMASRALSDEHGELFGVPIARDGIALIVHRDNPVSQLGNEQIVAIYGGKTRNWKEVGGRDQAIDLAKAEAGRSSTELFMEFFRLDYDAMATTTILGDNPERIRYVAERPAALLYMSIGEAERRAAAGDPIKLLPLEGVTASSDSVRSGDYPISRALTLITRGEAQGWAKTFIEFALSSAVNDLVLSHDFVPYPD